MEYRALYRKYRPQVFGEVIGQEHVTKTLVREARERRVAHAYLFAGPRGTGKTSTARILAKAINCEDPRPDGEPCDECATCQAISAGSSLDVQELDAASHNSVENIREIRVQVTMVAAGPSAHRVFILDEAHMLSTAACNALLKTLEEPPPNVHFILATTEPYKLLDTIRSRSQRFDFHPVPAETLTRHLRWVSEQEGYEVGDGGLEMVARHAQGSVRDSLSLLEQVAALGDGRVNPEGVERALGVADRASMMVLAKAVADRDAPAVLSLVGRLDRLGVNLRSFISEAIGFFRGVYLAHHLSDPRAVSDEPSETVEDWTQTAKTLSVSDVNRVIDQLGEALIKIREGREERLMLEMALLWIVRPETSIHPAALLRRIEALEARMTEARVPVPGVISTAGSTAADVSAASPPHPSKADVSSASASRPTTKPKESPAPAERPPAEASDSLPLTGPLTYQQVLGMWAEIVGGFNRMDNALLRQTRPVALEGNRLMIDCGSSFRGDRLKERNLGTRINEEILKRTDQKIKVEFVILAVDGASSLTPPPPPSADPPQPAPPRPDPGAQEAEEERPFSPPDATLEIEKIQAPKPDEEDGDGGGQPEADLKAFFEAAEISVTEVKHPSGPSLF